MGFIDFIKKIVRVLHKSLRPELDILEVDFSTFMDFVTRMNRYILLKDISTIYDIYSGPVYEKNYELLLQSFSIYKPINGFKLEKDDFIGVFYVETIRSSNFLVVLVFAPNFDMSIYVFDQIDKIPDFAIRQFVRYRDRYFYYIVQPSHDPVYVSDDILKKMGLSV